MKLLALDHFVLTTANADALIDFYTRVLGMRHSADRGRHALFFGNAKINIHTRPAEFLPAAKHPAAGTMDVCLAATGDIREIRSEILAKGWPVEEGVVTRHGARGEMESVYVRDPDGNLIEISVYPEEK